MSLSSSASFMRHAPRTRPHSVPFIVPVTNERLPASSSLPSASDARPETDSTFQVTPEALEVLGRIRVPVAPVAVVGKYRTGKSFLLNKLTSQGHGHGFEVGPTIEACTKGIWLWSEPAMVTLEDGSVIAVLYLDTEGIGAAGATAEHDARIFSLACLLASTLVYNSVGAVDEEAITNLSFIANLTQHIQVRTGGAGADRVIRAGAALEDAASAESGSDEDKEEGDVEDDDDSGIDSDDDDYIVQLKRNARKKRAAAKRAQAARLREEMQRAAGRKFKRGSVHGGDAAPVSRSSGEEAVPDADMSTFFPSFLWILRDFTLALVDEDGAPMSARDYLEACLAPQDGFSTDAQQRNRTRRVLTSFFKDRDCFTLVRPVDEEVKLQMVDSLDDDELRPEFQHQMQMLRLKLSTEMIRPKTMHGQFVTGRVLAGLAQAYVAAINAHAVPSISNAWDGVSKVECKEAFDGAYSAFSASLAGEVPAARLPLNQDELERVFEKHRVDALDAFDGKAVGPSADKYRRDLKDKLAADWRVLSSSNASASGEACARMIARLWHARIEPRLLKADDRSTPREGSDTPRSVLSMEDVYANYEDFAADLNAVKEEYLAEARGPATHRALAEFLLGAVPTVIRAINRARSAELEQRLADTQGRLTAVQEELNLVSARASVFEAQCTDLRKERQNTAIEKARLEQEAKSAREEMQHLQGRITDLEAAQADVTEKLRQERLAHAATRVAARAGGEHAATAASATSEVATRAARGSVDMSAIMGSDGDVGSAAVARGRGGGARHGRQQQSAGTDAMLSLRPRDALPAHVEFPEPPPPGGCGCTVQ